MSFLQAQTSYTYFPKPFIYTLKHIHRHKSIVCMCIYIYIFINVYVVYMYICIIIIIQYVYVCNIYVTYVIYIRNIHIQEVKASSPSKSFHYCFRHIFLYCLSLNNLILYLLLGHSSKCPYFWKVCDCFLLSKRLEP